MLYNSSEEIIAEDYFKFINDTIGFSALGMSLVSIKFQNSSGVATFLFLVLLVWTFSKGKEYQKIANRYLEHMKKRKSMFQVFWNMKFYLLGMATLFSVVVGALSEELVNSLVIF
ncbi:hypothetical protein [Pleionea litopenaei]|uniref:Uncharacterized protein n=1 Tax=Pleionea litopenaei TaxID=3070815 RepID=A0AA51RUL8_9GAMM|nr:hypothetical protein [Pleionea sp. HL-JVS1]WMS87902.1 hypothetical protein Q9312_03030 [Pleionea sp. HL-JVS1]